MHHKNKSRENQKKSFCIFFVVIFKSFNKVEKFYFCIWPMNFLGEELFLGLAKNKFIKRNFLYNNSH